MIKTVFLKEVREIVRDGRLRLLGALVLILTVVAMLFGAQQTQRAQEARRMPANVQRSSGSHRVRKIRMSQVIMGHTFSRRLMSQPRLTQVFRGILVAR